MSCCWYVQCHAFFMLPIIVHNKCAHRRTGLSYSIRSICTPRCMTKYPCICRPILPVFLECCTRQNRLQLIHIVAPFDAGKDVRSLCPTARTLATPCIRQQYNSTCIAVPQATALPWKMVLSSAVQGTCRNDVCVCTPGYSGTYCEVPPACAVILDVNGNCCNHGVVSSTGVCCGSVGLAPIHSPLSPLRDPPAPVV